MSAPSAESWRSLARAAARRGRAAPPADEERQLLAFRVAGDACALPVERVRSIARLRPITPVPRAPADVCGVVSLRGEIVQVVDLARRLGRVSESAPRGGRIVVVYGGDSGVAGLLVDAVSEVMRVPERDMRPAGAESVHVEALCLRGDRFVSVLDLDRVLDLDARS